MSSTEKAQLPLAQGHFGGFLVQETHILICPLHSWCEQDPDHCFLLFVGVIVLYYPYIVKCSSVWILQQNVMLENIKHLIEARES